MIRIVVIEKTFQKKRQQYSERLIINVYHGYSAQVSRRSTTMMMSIKSELVIKLVSCLRTLPRARPSFVH